MSDLISRQDAIAIATQEGAYGYISAEELAEMPSAERKGKWILHQDSRTWECSECHKYQVIHSDYCMHCGASMMRGEEDE